jgi:hypothetical protein
MKKPTIEQQMLDELKALREEVHQLRIQQPVVITQPVYIPQPVWPKDQWIGHPWWGVNPPWGGTAPQLSYPFSTGGYGGGPGTVYVSNFEA